MNDVIHRGLQEAQWQATERPGVTYALLRANPSGAFAIFLKFDAGVASGKHTHPEGEDLYVISGRIRIGGALLGPGDFLHTPPDGVHDACAEEPTILYLSAPKAPVFL